MSTSSATTVVSDTQMNYMNLLVTQLKYQDPLEPMDNNEMASQLAQFTQIQQLETMNNRFEKVLTAVERNYANSLLGKEVSFVAETESGIDYTQNGTVEQVYHNTNGEIWLVAGAHAVKLENVLSVEN